MVDPASDPAPASGLVITAAAVITSSATTAITPAIVTRLVERAAAGSTGGPVMGARLVGAPTGASHRQAGRAVYQCLQRN